MSEPIESAIVAEHDRQERGLNDRLLSSFLDGTLADAVEAIAVSGNPVEESVLLEAATKLRVSAELYRLVDEYPEYSAETTFAAIWKWLGRRDRALAKARGETL
jgi:hypothetical protein